MTPGVYDDLTNMAYHAETDWVSSSMLKRMLPDQYGPEPVNRKNLWFGSAFHTKVLGGPSEPWAIADYPTWDSKAAKAHAEEAEGSGFVPVLLKDVELIDAMADSLKTHSEASNLIYGTDGQSEVSVFAEVDSVPMRARFDRLTAAGTLVDLKTTSEKPSPVELAKAVVRYGYELSMSHYCAVARAAEIKVTDSCLIFVGKEPPHFVTVAYLDDAFLDRGDALCDIALSRYLHPQMVDQYPGQSEPVTLTLPRWAQL